MGRPVAPAERPQTGQIAVATMLVTLACVPLTAHLDARISAYAGFLVALRLASLRWPQLAPGRWLLLPLTLVGGANVFDAYHTFTGQVAGTALLVTMLALKLLEMQRLRDVRLVTILFGFLVASQFLFDRSPLLAAYLAALLIANFALMADLCAPAGKARVGSALRLASRLTLQALPLALVLFVLFPRLSAPLWNLNQAQDRARSGVKDWLEPGSVSDLVLSGELAFRARFDGPIPPPDALYWRGPVVWTTDGRRWFPAPPGLLSTQPAGLTRAEGHIHYEVVLDPTGQRWLFALDMPVEPPRDAAITEDFQVLAQRPLADTRLYRAVSALRYDTGELDPDQELAGLQLPDNVTARMHQLVEGWKAQSQDPAELVRRGLRFFNEEPFHYTLLPPKLGANPTDEFLFETRRGFCEHYAGSFALLMRIAGVPARIVLGYLGGEVNPIGGYLIVRQSDAHAWVEVWLPGQGWVRADPTAAVSPARVERSDLLQGLAAGSPLRFRLDEADRLARWVHNLRLLADAIDAGWRDWVLDYTRIRQQRLLESVGLGYLRDYGLAFAMVIAAGTALGLLVVSLARNQVRPDPLERLYARFCHRLARMGLVRRPSEGPVAYASRVVTLRPDLRDAIDAFLALYLPLRYGREQAEDRVRELERRLGRF